MSASPPAMIHATSTQDLDETAIFDVLSDPRKTNSDIETFVRTNPSCLGAVSAQNGLTPLHEAARRGDSKLIRFFVNNGAVVEVKGHAGETPFLMACDSGSLYAVHTLVECGADTKVVDNMGRSAVHHAAMIGAIHILHYLGETQGFNFREVDAEGNSALHFAVLRRNMDTMKYLLRNKRADRYAGNKKGVTPLHLAVRHISGPMAWLLLSTSNVKKLLAAKDENGCTPIQLALSGNTSKHKVLAQKMENFHIDPNHMKRLPWVAWTFFAILPAVALTLSPLLFSYFRQPMGFILALLMAIFGLFVPMTFTRIPGDEPWQNPTPMTGLVFGVTATTLCYFIMVFPRLWPTNFLAFIILTTNSFILVYLFFKLKLSNPGREKVGKIGEDGQPMTIVDVAKQGGTSSSGKDLNQLTHSTPDTCAFCTCCEIVIPDRTKHCKLCNACCNGFDHHCTWLTNCIGYNNHRTFVIFTFLLGLDNFLFLYESFKLLSVLSGSTNLWYLLVECFTSEHWIMILIICNAIALFFCMMNFFGQVSHISKLETTYFDMSGKAAYKSPRERKNFTMATRLHLIYLFFMDYKRWYNRPKFDVTSACYPKFSV